MLTNHAEVEKLISQADNRTYAWDYILCKSDTVKGKFQNLHEIIATLCVRAHDHATPKVIAPNQLTGALLAVIPVEELITAYQEMQDITYYGEIKHDCGYGYQSGFHLYRDDQLTDIVVNYKNVRVVKIFNYPW